MIIDMCFFIFWMYASEINDEKKPPSALFNNTVLKKYITNDEVYY